MDTSEEEGETEGSERIPLFHHSSSTSNDPAHQIIDSNISKANGVSTTPETWTAADDSHKKVTLDHVPANDSNNKDISYDDPANDSQKKAVPADDSNNKGASGEVPPNDSHKKRSSNPFSAADSHKKTGSRLFPAAKSHKRTGSNPFPATDSHKKTGSHPFSAADSHKRTRSLRFSAADSRNQAHLLPDRSDFSPFLASAGETSRVRVCVSSSAFDPNSGLAHHYLILASRSGNVEATQLLLKAGVSVHCKDEETDWEPIHIATYHNHVAVVEAVSVHEAWWGGVARVKLNGITCNILHLASAASSLAVLRYLLSHTVRLGLQIDSSDEGGWSSLHHAASEGHLQALTLLMQAGADVNTSDPQGVTALHVAAYRDRFAIVRYLLSRGANPHIIVKPPGKTAGGSVQVRDRVMPIADFHAGSSLLHWASGKGYEDLVAEFIAKGLRKNSTDRAGKTPLGLALWGGHIGIINKHFKHASLSEEDKAWGDLSSEEAGMSVVRTIEQTGTCPLTSCRADGLTLLHLAAGKGYSTMMTKLLDLGVSPDVTDSNGETPLFSAIRHNHLVCVQALIRAGTNLSLLDKYGNSPLHMAAKNGNVSVTDMLLTSTEKNRDININGCNALGYTPMYYAMVGSRYDIVQRFLEFSLERRVHPMATDKETLLQFFTERNNLGQYDNAVVRMLECEKLLHKSKPDAETCLRVQLGTTETSSKARDQLQAMYEVTKVQKHCWNFWFVLSLLLMPSVLYYLDMYTDLLLAVEYYHDYKYFSNSSSVESANASDSLQACYGTSENDTSFMSIFYGITHCQLKINFVLTLFFILFPFTLLSMWNLYIHVTQPDILPVFQRLPNLLRVSLYVLIFLTPVAPIMVYFENTYAQIKYMNFTARQMQEVDLKTQHQPLRAQSSLRDEVSYDLKHVAQVRVAITNVMEATLESAFQLILQLYIVGTRYNELGKVKDTTLGSILSLSPRGSETQLSMQVFSVLISLVTLTWSFTSYHRFSKLGGLTILSALPLLFSIFFQVVSRAVACTLFTLALTWRVFAVLGFHFIMVLVLKLWLEESSLGQYRPEYISGTLDCSKWNQWKCLKCLRSYFYVFLGTIASTLIYFRLERPSSSKKLSRRHSTVAIQVLFLTLALIENLVLLSVGVVYLDKTRYDQSFIIFCCVACGLSYLTGVILHIVYYSCFGHPWVNINGPIVSRDPENCRPVLAYYTEGRISKRPLPSCCWVPDSWYTELPTDIYQREAQEISQERRKLVG